MSVHEPIEINCPACGKPVTLWAPDPSLEIAGLDGFSGDLDAWACPWCKARHPEDSLGVLRFAMSGHQAAEIREVLKFADADSMTFPDECRHCHGAVMVRLTHMRLYRKMMHPGSWKCPYCQKVNGGESAGQIEWVRKRIGDEEPTIE